ncbi:FxsA family protein [Denitrificimonas caeni]|uniref:FxsA family protein n=1 Tax=Denitrificimonas caeni TaxID=521720 RepID=UPI0019653563|nr:FxsA family protein [Denitrificimonas caeni]
MRGLFLVFLAFPLLELFVMIRVGSSIGAAATLLLVLASGALGVLCIRLAGLTTALSVRQRMAQGEVPNREMLNGLLLVVAGGLLFLPGFISDVVGLVCLLPITRQWLINRIGRHMTQRPAQSQQFYTQSSTYTEQRRGPENRPAQIIEGEFERKDP